MTERIDVFFCHIPCVEPETRFRNYLARACLERWLLDPRARVVLVQPAGTEPLASGIEVVDSGPRERFHVMRYRVPRARPSDWYIVADDDCLPLGRDFVERALAAVAAYPDYGVLAASDVAAQFVSVISAAKRDSRAVRSAVDERDLRVAPRAAASRRPCGACVSQTAPPPPPRNPNCAEAATAQHAGLIQRE